MNQKTLLVAAAEPGVMYPGMLWFDTDDDKLKERNNANDDWIERPGLSLAATITGLWTFDRGIDAPFAVGAASLTVTNLDADTVDTQHRVLTINADHTHQSTGAQGGKIDYALIHDSEKNLLLDTTDETEVCAYSLDATNRIMRVAVFFRVVTGTTVVTVKVYYTNAANAAITCTLVDAKSLVVNDYTYAPIILEAKASTEVSLKVTAGTANRVYVTGTIEELA